MTQRTRCPLAQNACLLGALLVGSLIPATALGASPTQLGKTCALALRGITARAWHPSGRIDPAQTGPVLHAARTCLSAYVQVDTSNPPGNEARAVAFWKVVFRSLGLRTRTAPLARTTAADAQRGSLIATLGTPGKPGSIILLNHTDVVRADGTWKFPPFAGKDDGTFIWGRGALDMKGVAIVQLISLAVLKKARVPLRRTIHFTAVADEELGARGAEYVAYTKIIDDASTGPKDPLGLKPALVLNEGGAGIRDALLGGHDVFLVGVEEKGLLWTQYAHRDPRRLISALAKAHILKAPRRKALAPGRTMRRLGKLCALSGLVSDPQQKANVQPRQATLTFDCAKGAGSLLKDAANRLARGIHPAPAVTVETKAAGSRDQHVVKVEVGAGGHGAVGGMSTGLDVAVALLVSTGQLRLRDLRAERGARQRFFRYGISPANKRFITRLARNFGLGAAKAGGWLAGKRGLVDRILSLVGGKLPTDATFRNTCSWTTFLFPAPGGEARAKIDCRLNYDTTSAAYQQLLKAHFAKYGAALRNDHAACYDCKHQEFNQSPLNTHYGIVRDVLGRSSPRAIVAPYQFLAASDSYHFRRAGVPTFGMLSAALGEAEMRTFHGLDERFPVAALFPAIKAYGEILHRAANDRSVARLDAGHRLGTRQISCQKRERRGLFRKRYQWSRAASSTVSCGVRDTVYRCDAKGGAPRFLRASPEGADVKLLEVLRLKSSYRGSGKERERLPAAGYVAGVVHRAQKKGTRIITGQEFEIDTGAARGNRQFLIRCSTGALQSLGRGLKRGVIRFYKD